jgi:hypothetical protein
MHVPDMKLVGPGWFAVGWLNPEHSFPRASLPPHFTARLKEFASRWTHSVQALGWGVAGGYHTCEFCGQCHGCGTFGVVAADRVFDCPDMIAHYVEQHGYAPPPQFITATIACPLPDTREYLIAATPYKLRGYVEGRSRPISMQELIRFALGHGRVLRMESLPHLDSSDQEPTAGKALFRIVRGDSNVGVMMRDDSGMVVVTGKDDAVDKVVVKACAALDAQFRPLQPSV